MKFILSLLCLLIIFDSEHILYMDETGFYQRQYYQRGWSPIGQPCHAKIDAKRGSRLNVIAAMSMNQFKPIAPVLFDASCKRDVVESWLHTLGQSLSKAEDGTYPKRFLIMDNARFHHGGQLNEIAKQYNICLVYLPHYSPNLNPIEQLWAVIKQKVRLLINTFDSLHDCVRHCVL